MNDRSLSSGVYPLLALLGWALMAVEVSGCAHPTNPGAEPDQVISSAQPDRQAGVARDISDVELLSLMAERPDLLLVDVRTDREWKDGHIEGACFLDFLEDDFPARAKTLPRDRPIAVYCAAGGRSADAMAFLAKAGYREVYNLRGGFYGWEDAGNSVSNAPPVALPGEE
jgi:rhodanese-related sulfurtransferase